MNKPLLAAGLYHEAEPLLVKGYEGLKARARTIPLQAATPIPEALDRLIALYIATNQPEQIKKYEAERALFPAARLLNPIHTVGAGLKLQGKLDRQTAMLIHQVRLEKEVEYLIGLASADPKASIRICIRRKE